jgi:ADP-ribosylglycohydrolase
MRVAPIGMLFHALSTSNPDARVENLQRAFDLGCDAAALTHGHPTGFLAAGVMAALVFELLDGAELLSAIERAIPWSKPGSITRSYFRRWKMHEDFISPPPPQTMPSGTLEGDGLPRRAWPSACIALSRRQTSRTVS